VHKKTIEIVIFFTIIREPFVQPNGFIRVFDF